MRRQVKTMRRRRWTKTIRQEEVTIGGGKCRGRDTAVMNMGEQAAVDEQRRQPAANTVVVAVDGADELQRQWIWGVSDNGYACRGWTAATIIAGGRDSDGNDCRRRVAAAMNKGTKLRRLWQHRWRQQLALPRHRRGWWWRQLAHPLFHSTAEACCEWFFIGTGQANGWGWSRGGGLVSRGSIEGDGDIY